MVESRTEAQLAIAAGLVTVDGAPATKSATQVLPDQALVVSDPPRQYVSRGGDKLAHGLGTFDVDPAGRRCLDVGMSTGGFTDCLLQAGAAQVIGVDVGYGQVHDRIRTDPRVDVRERTNVRDLTPDDLEPPLPDLIVCDVSFIALATVLPALRPLGAPDAEAVVLVKPQFEARRGQVGKGGVVRDPVVWAEVLSAVADAAVGVGWHVVGTTASPLLGPAGNVEFLVHLCADAADEPVEVLVAAAVAEGRAMMHR